MDYRQAIGYLQGLVNHEQTREVAAIQSIKLERMRRLCRRLGDPQRRFRSVLVAGTDGKGSICAMVYAMLRAGSLRAGLYTSPHLEQVRERIRMGHAPIGDEPEGVDWISEADCSALVQELRPIFDELSASADGPLTHFEALTAMAFVYFARRGVDIAVVEVGLGGRLDATNVLEPSVSVMAPVDLDHTEILGQDRVQIAREKAGIIRSGQTLLTAVQPTDVQEVLRVMCEAHGVPLIECGQPQQAVVHRHGIDGLEVSITGLRGSYPHLHLPLLGRHQASNAAVAVAALEALSQTGIPSTLVEQGLSQVRWPGRLEIVYEAPTVILDGAHNPLAARALRGALEELWPGRKIQLLVGMSSDKPVEAIGQILGPISASATCTRSRHPRAIDPVALATRLEASFQDVHVMSDPLDGYTYLLNALGSSDILVVTGSLFLVGEIRAALRQAHVRPRRVPAYR